MLTKKNLMKYISEYISECNRLGLQLKRVILFGSYAHNTAHKWSDIDLALVSDDFTGMRLDDREKTPQARLQIKYGLRYIQMRYGSKNDPTGACGAWTFWQRHNWY